MRMCGIQIYLNVGGESQLSSVCKTYSVASLFFTFCKDLKKGSRGSFVPRCNERKERWR